MGGSSMRWIAAALLLAAGAGADVLETRDGRLLEGSYLGGTAQAVRFEVGGSVEVIPVGQVLAVTFTREGSAAASPAGSGRAATPATAANRTAPAPKPRLARVPAGTWLRVRLADGIDPRQSAVDDRFTASLETALGTGDTVVVPAGTHVQGRVAELRATGPVASRLKLELTQLVHQGRPLDIVTGTHQPARPASGEAAPARDGDGSGPAAASADSTIPVRPGVAPGAVLEFRLLQPFDVPLP